MSYRLKVNNLHLQFDTEEGVAKVLDGVDLTLEAGETTALVGETGCGKSVTARAILGLLPKSASIPEGEILFEGENLLELSEQELHTRRGSEIGIIMQDPMTALNPVFTIGEQMLDVMKYQGQTRVSIFQILRDKFLDQSDLKEKAKHMLEKVQISAPERVLESYPIELSGGMRQRVLIAIALLSEPDLLIADEPGTALDVTTEDKILGLLDELISDFDTSVLYITHDLGVARNVSNRINVMYAGEIVESAPTDKLFQRPQHPYTRGLLDSIPQLSKGIGAGIEGELPNYTDPPKGCRFKERCPFAKPECTNTFPYPRETSDDHRVACHLYEGAPAYQRHEQLAREADAYIGPPAWNQGVKHE